MPRFARADSGEWIKPKMRGYKMMCCDCGLVHTLDFRVIRHARGHKVLFRAYRNARSTALARRREREVRVSGG